LSFNTANDDWQTDTRICTTLRSLTNNGVASLKAGPHPVISYGRMVDIGTWLFFGVISGRPGNVGAFTDGSFLDEIIRRLLPPNRTNCIGKGSRGEQTNEDIFMAINLAPYIK